MKCPECGAEVQANSTFCQACGARTDQVASGAGEPATTPKERFKQEATPRSSSGPETDLWVGGYSPKAMIGAWVLAGLVTIAAIVAGVMFFKDPMGWTILIGVVAAIWVVLLLRLAYMRLSVSYRLTNHRFFHELGLLSRTTDRIEVIDMDDITFKQGIVERMLGVGSVHITSSDRSTPELWLHGIDDVKAVADLLDKARRAERDRRGMYIEQI